MVIVGKMFNWNFTLKKEMKLRKRVCFIVNKM